MRLLGYYSPIYTKLNESKEGTFTVNKRKTILFFSIESLIEIVLVPKYSPHSCFIENTDTKLIYKVTYVVFGHFVMSCARSGQLFSENTFDSERRGT